MGGMPMPPDADGRQAAKQEGSAFYEGYFDGFEKVADEGGALAEACLSGFPRLKAGLPDLLRQLRASFTARKRSPSQSWC
jgi:hypothetical protein